MGRSEEAEDSWRRALRALDTLPRESEATEVLSLRARALLHLARLEEVTPIIAILMGRGYKQLDLMRLAREKGAIR